MEAPQCREYGGWSPLGIGENPIILKKWGLEVRILVHSLALLMDIQ